MPKDFLIRLVVQPSMCPALLAVCATGFPLLRRVGLLAEAISKCQCCYSGIQKVMEGGSCILDISNSAAWCKCVQDVSHV